MDKLPKAFKLKSKWGPVVGPKTLIISDTFIIRIEGPKRDCLNYMSVVTSFLMHELYSLGLFVRGAISFGKYSIKDTTLIGPAIDDAASWFEMPNMIGVVTTPTASYIVDTNAKVGQFARNPTLNSKFSYFVKYNIPCTDNKTYELNAVNWPCFFNNVMLFDNQNFSTSFLKLSLVEQDIEKLDHFNAGTHKKYENTFKFIDTSLSHFTLHRQ